MMKKSTAFIAISAMVVSLAAPAAVYADDGTIKVGFAIKTMKEPYFVKLVDGLQEACDEKGWEFSYLTADDDSIKESENMETFITQGMDVIFLDSVDPDACIPSIDAAAEAGIPVINLDSDVNGGDYVTTVYSNNDENGRLAGNEYIKWLNEQGREDEEIVAILVSGTKGNVAGVERREGLMAGIIQGRTECSDEDAFAAAEEMEAQLQSGGKAENTDANFRIVGQGWGNWVIEDGLTATEDFITANPDVNVILGENDQMLFGSLTALENAGLTGVALLAAADGACDAYDLIKENEDADNPYIATGLNSPVLVGQYGMDIAAQIVEEGASWDSFDKITKTEAAAITVDNVDDYYDIGF
ncbi:MAG: substrate-binding domain-containing protein [Eubacteriales bacterium]|nr:substrate-binding domain-containing protein [Eubacteriales bacterium]